MSDRREELGGETDIAIVTFTDPANLAGYHERYGFTLPIVVDRDRSAYETFGLGSASTRRVWSLGVLKRYLEIFRSDGLRNLRKPTEDTRQLGGDFIIDPEGVLIFGFWGAGPDDRPTVDQLIEALKR